MLKMSLLISITVIWWAQQWVAREGNCNFCIALVPKPTMTRL